MGVRQLLSVIQQIKIEGVVINADLREIAEQWIIGNGSPAVVLADGYNIARKFGNDYDFLIGGEYKQTVQTVHKFIDACRAISVELVFYFDGPKRWRRRRKYCYKRKEIEMLLDGIEKHAFFRQSVDDDHRPPLYNMVVIEAASTRGCKVVHSLGHRGRSITQYVIENKCMGVISSDTTLLVFEGIPHVFSDKDLDINELTTVEYVRDELFDAIGLNRGAESIFATLMGNNAVNHVLSMRYHRRKFGTEYPRLHNVTTLAETANRIHGDSNGDIKQAAQLLTEEILKSQGYVRNDILWSLTSYDLNIQINFKSDRVGPITNSTNWTNLLTYCHQKYTDYCQIHQAITVMKDNFFGKIWSLEGDRLCNAAVLAELRKRIYSVLLFEKNVPHGETEFVEERFFTGCRNMDFTYLVGTIHVDVEHPGVYRLWEDGNELDDIRWNLFAWIFSTGTPECVLGDREMSFFKNLDQLAVMGLILLYLYNVLIKSSNDEIQYKMDKKSFEALIVLAASVPVMEPEELGQRSVNYITQDFACLSTIFQETYIDVCWALSICGLKFQSEACDSYSGLLFHYLMQEEDPTKLLNEVAPQAKQNYSTLTSALDACGASLSSVPRMVPGNFFPF